MKLPWASLVSPFSAKSSPDRNTTHPNSERPRFRILVTGRSGSGKLSLTEAVFGASPKDVIRDPNGIIDINQEIIPRHNKHIAIHHSHNDILGNTGKLDALKSFVAGRTQKKLLSDRIHAIWFCISTPLDDRNIVLGRAALKMTQNKVPIIIVFTKFDLFISQLGDRGKPTDRNTQELAEKEFQKKYSQELEALSKNGTPYALVATSQRETLQRLIDVTLRSMSNGASKGNRKTTLGGGRDISSPVQIALVAAQRVGTQAKVAASIRMGGQTWDAIASDEHFFNVTLGKRVSEIHNDIVTIWNIRDLDEFLLERPFRLRMMSIVEDFNWGGNASTTNPDVTMASDVGGRLTKDVNRGRPEDIRLLMTYLVDLILILQGVFQVSLEDQFKGEDDVNEIIYEFICSKRRESVHDTITAIVENKRPSTSDNIMDKLTSLIKEKEITKDDVESFRTRGPLPSLLAILKVENSINRVTLDLISKLLDPPDYLSFVSELETSDVALLLDFILLVLRGGSLENYTAKKARRLLEKLSRTNILPKSLFIHDVKTDLATIGVGGFGSVFRGERRGGDPVALKVLYKARNMEESLQKDFCREALAWWSLKHQFILPLLGVYESNAHLFLVSPYMPNGTLFQWRQSHWPGEVEIRRMMFEVAQALQYIHSQGIVHGDLSGADVLLDLELHCHISDFGLTRHIESTLSPSVMAISANYAAPELVGMCSQCCQTPCTCGRSEDYKGKTTQTDVYAFGCLYYTVFFGTMPFQGESLFQIIPNVLSEKRPSRLDSPRMDDNTWNLIQQCWYQNPSERPTMEQIVETHMTRPASLLTTVIIELRALGGSMITPRTIDYIHKILDFPDFDSITSQLRITADVELLLDFILQIISSRSLASSPDANRKARKLMFKLVSTTNTLPKSLFITSVMTEPHLGVIGMGGFGGVFRGKYQKREVAMKVIYKGRKDESLRQDFCQQALLWRSLKHRYILPLEGIFEGRSQSFFVSSFMANGTLRNWRGNRIPSVADIYRLMLEAGEGVHYLHSEGIVHGDLHGENILVDDDLHCQISGFGLSRPSEAAVAQSTTAFYLPYAAPELFGLCAKCGRPDCDEGLEVQHCGKTTETDVYAFGCLYYAIFFDTVPFRGYNDYQIVHLVTRGKRPDRLDSPRMDKNIWDLIQSCWESMPSKRPTMEQIVIRLSSVTQPTEWQGDVKDLKKILGDVGDLLSTIIALCDSLSQNKNTARQLAERCGQLCVYLKQYEALPMPQQTVKYRDDVFKCLIQVNDTFRTWSQKSWLNMLVGQTEFKAELSNCDTRIFDCFTVLVTAMHKEVLVHEEEVENRRKLLQESRDADHVNVMKQLSAVDFKQRIMDSKVTKSSDDVRTLSEMMQKGLAEHRIVSEEEQKRMAKNLYDLLRLSDQLPPNCQLDGMVELSGEATQRDRDADMYKGRYLHSQDVRIKVIRSVNAGDEKSIKRIRREVELWATVQQKDHGKHIVPFYGFFTPDGLRLGLVRPWMENGDVLEYIKANVNIIDYKQLIVGIAEGVKVLHSMDPPIVHGNLRAENILIGDEGQPLITDFALAKLEGNLITQSSGVSDNCRWIAPEMFEEQAMVSPKGDIYSFGMTILQLFTHDKPYPDKKTFQVFRQKIVGGLPDRPQDQLVIKRGLDDRMWDLLCRCWAMNPADRPLIDELIPQLWDIFT